MTDHYEVIIIGTGEDGIPASGKCDEIVHQIDQEIKGMVSNSSMTHMTHGFTHAIQT